MKAVWKLFLADETGVTAVEYGLIGGFVVGAAALGATALSNSVESLFSFVTSFFNRF
ncbi:Flp family type IVb pilin [Burkholderia gladioli]|uniref:Flp family type IVb pilin n=1 Tax=Burkholderia gladioli TaxID=28095 RepID=UPI00163F1047|nr:Flp family type IVb pilin [Burkholderia gladioli]MDN7811818.1 Flp family type IVb pilin [Burkholderia gladioli]